MILLNLLTLLACDNSVFGETKDTQDSGTPWWESDYDLEGDDPPEILEGRSWCEGAEGSAGDIFYFYVKGFDKQMEETITGGSIVATGEAGELFDHPLLYCNEQGECEGSWTASSWSGELVCSESAVQTYSFVGYLVDDQGNESERAVLDWEGIVEPEGGGE